MVGGWDGTEGAKRKNWEGSGELEGLEDVITSSDVGENGS